MIDTAVRLFQLHGYHATSWRGLVTASETPWGSVHHHFPGGKEELGVAAITAGGDMVASLIQSCQRRTDNPGAAIRRWFTISAELLRKGEFAGGCPIATVALETASESPALAGACATGFAGWVALIRDHLHASGLPAERAAQLATVVVAGFEGSLLLARIQRSTAPVEAAAEALAGLVDAELAQLARPAKRTKS